MRKRSLLCTVALLCAALCSVCNAAENEVGPGLLFQKPSSAPTADASLLQVKEQSKVAVAETVQAADKASAAESERHKHLLARVASSFALVGTVALPFVASTPEEIRQQERLYEQEWAELEKLQKSDPVVALEVDTQVLSTEAHSAEKVLERLKLMQYPQSSAARRASHKVAPAASSFVPEERTFISAAAAPSDTVTLAELAASSARAERRRHSPEPGRSARTDVLRDISDEESDQDEENTDSEGEQDQDEDQLQGDDDSEMSSADGDVDYPARMRFARRNIFKKAWNGIKKAGKWVGEKLFGKKKKKKDVPKAETQAQIKAQKPVTPQEVEDCVGCRFVWGQVEMDIGAARYVEDVQASFEHNCMDAQKSTVFYGVCEDMYDDMYAMTDDYMSNKFSIKEMCQRAKLCRAPPHKDKPFTGPAGQKKKRKSRQKR